LLLFLLGAILGAAVVAMWARAEIRDLMDTLRRISEFDHRRQ
jgi:hypothetical protein